MPVLDDVVMETPACIDAWFTDLQPWPLREFIREPRTTAVFCVDMVRGTCRDGAFASKRLAGLIPRIVSFLEHAWELGVRKVFVMHDAHQRACPEFRVFPAHCVEGSGETEVVSELSGLPFAGQFVQVRRNSLHPAIGTGLERLLADEDEVKTSIIVGGFTDLSVYQLTMYLRLRANALNVHDARVVVPANLVDTYNWSEHSALHMGFMPHLGDFFHRVFLYHMALNGVQVVRELGASPDAS